jgi:hypothetical protein
LCHAALQQRAKPVRHQFPAALEAQPLSQRVDHRLSVCVVVEAFAVGVRRRQYEIVGHLLRTGRIPEALLPLIGIPPASPRLLAPLGLLQSPALSVISTHQQMMTGGCLTAADTA